jgi:hypothetical protein
MSRDDHKWIIDYEKSRFKESKIPNESWASSRYGPQYMNWAEAQQVYLPGLKMCVGPAWFHLRKLWGKYKRNNRLGESNSDIAYQINLYQKNLDIPRTPFDELEGIISEHEFEDLDSLEHHPPEWSELDEVLRHEEQESEAESKAEAEIDDWWGSNN